MSAPSKRIYLSPPHIGTMEEELVAEAFASNWIAPLGAHVDAFEREVADYVGCRAALALSSGTAAIHLALRLCEVGIGDTVFCSNLTFVASANPILYLGATPVFIDSEPDTWNMSPNALRRAFERANRENRLPKAVIVVNLYGQSADMEPILEICTEYEVPVVEDAAESLGARYKGRMSGSFGKFAAFSFNGNKIITTSGGGMLVSDDCAAIEKARFWATQARDAARHYQHSEIGYNYRLSNVLAAVGRGQLRVLEERILARRTVFSRYQRELATVKGFTWMSEPAHFHSTRWLSAMLVDERECGISPVQLIEALDRENIEARPVWKPMHVQPLYSGYPYEPHDRDVSLSDTLFQRGICLPSGSNLSEAEQDRVIECLKRCVQSGVYEHADVRTTQAPL